MAFSSSISDHCEVLVVLKAVTDEDMTKEAQRKIDNFIVGC
jgi:hypothetical protein